MAEISVYLLDPFGFSKKLKDCNECNIHVDSEGGKHGGPLISEVINITLDSWTLANNFHAQGEILVKSEFGKMVSLNSSHHWILQGFDRWGRVGPEGQKTLRFGHEGAGVGDEQQSQLGMFLVFDFLFGWDRFF